MTHLVHGISKKDWKRFRNFHEDNSSTIYSDNTGDCIHIHFVYSKKEYHRFMNEQDFQKFQNKLFNF